MPVIMPYNRDAATAYARRWAYGRNPKYYDFENLGGDCTNFASQVIFAGAGVMNYTPTMGWYYKNLNDRTPSWSGVEYLYRFLVNNSGPGPFAREVKEWEIKAGDILQLSFYGGAFHHSPVVISAGNPPREDNILIAAHTYDAYDRPLSTYSYRDIRFIGIVGVRL